MLLAAGFGTILPAFAILPANLPNMVLLGVAETLYGVSPSYGSWLLLHFPVLGLLHALLLAELICRLFPGCGRRAPRSARGDPLPPWRAAEIRLLAILLLALAPVGDGFASRRVARLGRARARRCLHAAGHRRARRARVRERDQLQHLLLCRRACSAWSA